ncbi:hypothetical protein Sjap_018276 [Stephania japonica]|uniref:Rab escort protein 1 n=1 Tax=Stephania japonica TaxID=461633 RepID=A0AAP0NMZ4_9MAGN
MAEQDASIEPSSFDLIVVGTGLPESIIAAAASAAGKSVLHLDHHSFYGAHFSSLPLRDLLPFLRSNSPTTTTTTIEDNNSDSNNGTDYVALPLKPRSLYTHIEEHQLVSDDDLPLLLGASREFYLDLSGPRACFCADAAVDLMLKSGASHHIDFKSVEATFMYSSGENKLVSVPDSRSAIFKDRSLSLLHKNQLMRFFKLVQDHCQASGADDDGNGNGNGNGNDRRISDEDLESPFVDFLNKHRLPPNIKSIILYAIAMADYDQDTAELPKNVVKTKRGIERLALYHSSVGRFVNAQGALIYPIYGQGELPQAFCRCAAVKGALYVLRMPVTDVLIEKESNVYKGVKLKSGQEIFSNRLVMGPTFTLPPPSVSSSISELQKESSESVGLGMVKEQVARGVCIIRGSINADISNLLVVFPPHSLHPEQISTVRALQLSSNVHVCPSGLFVLYLSTICEDASRGKESLHAAMKTLLTHPSERDESTVTKQNVDTEEKTKPTLLWSAMYVQELTEIEGPQDSLDAISRCPVPDGSLDYRNMLESTMKLFHNVCPGEDIFPEREAVEEPDL